MPVTAQAYEGAYEAYLIPLERHIGEELSAQLLPDFEDERSVVDRYVRHDLSQVRALQEDEDAKHTRVQGDFKSEIIDRAEARSALGYEPKPEDEGVFYGEKEEPELPEIDQPAQLRLVKAVNGIIKPNGHEHQFKGLNCVVCQKSVAELWEEIKKVPTENEVQEAIDWLEEVNPELAELVEA